MARRDDVSSRGPGLWTAFCLVLCSLGFLGSACGATITVTNTNDSGANSLRAAITTANGDTGDTIDITATGTITLLSALPAITADMTLSGPGVTSLTVSGNNSTTVGTIFTINSGATVSISGLTIANGNSNAVNAGGGILNNGTLTIDDCTISSNTRSGSGNEGGGITNFGTLTVSSSTFSGNSGSQGGGIFNGQTNALTVVNSTFSGNSVTTKGGGIYNYPGGTLTVTNSTISANSAGEDGGGLETNGTTTTITNSIVAGNTATANDDVDGTYTDGGGNLVGTAGINLAPLANYGGPTQTMLPLPNSPALCAGIPTALATDQRGFPLGVSGYCTSGKIDSGAVQTNYTAIQFTNAGANGYAAAVNSAVAFPAPPIVSVTENGQNIGGVPVTLTFSGAGTATGLGPVTTVAGTGATFNSVSVSEAGADTLDAQLTLRSTILDTSANLKIVMITLTPAAGVLSGATKGEPYSMVFIASGGSTSIYTYTHSITSGTLPAGLSFNDGTATLSGTPTATGSVGFTITATDSNGFSGTQSYSLTVNPSVMATQSISTKILTVNQASTSFTPVTGSGGTAPLSYSISPSLPTGLSISSSTGTITGMPAATSPATMYTVTVADVNSSTATASFSLTVNPGVTATTAVPSKILTANHPVTSFTPVTGSGGTAPLSYSIAPSLPAGLNLSSSTGAITGTPLAASPQTTYQVTITDASNTTASSNFSLTVNSAVTATEAIPATMLTVGQSPASFTPVTATGGTAPLTYSISPSLPAGLSLNTSTGAITGMPTAASPQTMYTVTITDGNQATGTASFSLTVNSALTATSVNTETLSVNQMASFAPVTGSGGTAPLHYSIAPSLSAALSISSSTGLITGAPTATKAATLYTVTITDANQVTAQANFTLTVIPATTNISVTSSSAGNTSTINESVTFTATVTAAAGSATLAGTVTFTDNGNPIPNCSITVNPVNGMAVCTTASLALGSHSIKTTYGNDNNFSGSSGMITQTVNPAPTTTALISSAPNNTSTVNQSVSFTATVTGTAGSTALSGVVNFTDNGAPIAGCTSLTVKPATGVAICTTAALLKGAHTITAAYANDTNFSSSNTSLMQTVNAAASATALVSSLNPSVVRNTNNHNDTVTFTATVTPITGPVLLSGAVTFTDGGNPIPECGSPVPVNPATGIATCTTTSLGFGAHTILGVYGSDPNFLSSNSTVSQSVQDYGLSSSPAPVYVTLGYTSLNDVFTPQVTSAGMSSIVVTPVPISGFTGNLALTCSVVPVTTATTAVPPACTLGSPTVTITSTGAQTAVTVIIDATNSATTAGAYSVSVTGVDSTTGLAHTTAPFITYVRAKTAPITIVSGATTGNTTNADFILPANIGLTNLKCSSVGGPTLMSNVDPAGLSIGCTFNPSSVPSATTIQTGTVAVAISTNGTTTAQLVTNTGIFAASLIGIPVLALVGFLRGGKSSRRSFFRYLGVLFIAAAVMQTIGCGGHFTRTTTNTGLTPPGTYLVLVQGTGSDGLTYDAVFQVDVTR